MGAGVEIGDEFCVEAVACGVHATDGETLDTQRALVNQAFDVVAKCPKFCYPGTETHTDDGKQDTDGICIGHADAEMVRNILNDMPNYKKSGTGGRFPEAFDTMSKSICSSVQNAISGVCCAALNDPEKCGVSECPDNGVSALKSRKAFISNKCSQGSCTVTVTLA